MVKNVRGLQKGQKLGRRYPWDDWLSRSSFALIRGKDYDCMPHGMGQMIRSRCYDRGLRARVKISPDGRIDVQLENARNN